MSNTTAKSSYDIQYLSTVITVVDQYMLIILYLTGTIGAILNIFTFLQKIIRRNTCSMYFLATSIVDFCIMNIPLLMEIIGSFNRPLAARIYSTRMWCKFGNYIMFILPCLSSGYITLASIDRFCASSLTMSLRKFSNLKITRIVVIIIFLIWILFGLHIPIAYDFVRNVVTNVYVCTVQTNSATIFIIIDGYFFSLFNGAIVPFLLCIFGLLIYYNVQKSRRRVGPQLQNNNRFTRQNIHMITMVLVQVFCTTIFNIPYVVIYLLSYHLKLPTNPLSIYLIIIFSFIARWFYYMNYCKTFYVNTLTSGHFRDSLRKQFTQFIRLHRTNLISRSIQP